MKINKQVSELSGEILTISPDHEIPIAPSVNIERLREIDPDPVFATVKIKAGRGDQGKGPMYGPDVLRSLEEQFNSKVPPGYLGHQHPDNVSWEYREPVTSWLGAVYNEDEESLYVKGYVPPTAEQLRSQLRLAEAGADLVNSVSIFGTRSVSGDSVNGFDLWSLDWTPKGRAGMETELVSVAGEQANDDDKQEDPPMEITRSDVPDEVIGEITSEAVAPYTALVGEMKVILELDDDAESEAVLASVRELVEAKQKDERAEAIAEMVKSHEDVSGEMVTEAVTELVTRSSATTPEEIGAEIEAALGQPYVKALKDGATPPVVRGNFASDTDSERTGTSWA
jgi:hypothetical protein